MTTTASKPASRLVAAQGYVTECLIFACCLVGFFQVVRGKEKKEPESRLVHVMIAAIRQPKAGEFPRPESAVRFLLEQVKRQDIDEAAKVFPILERYRGVSFSRHARWLQACDWARSPLPGAPYRNLTMAMEYLRMYDGLSLTLLLKESPDTMRYLGKNALDKQIEALEKELDRSQLQSLKVAQVQAGTAIPIPSDNEIARAMGTRERQIVKASVNFDGREFEFSFITVRIGDNWRVERIDQLSISPENRP